MVRTQLTHESTNFVKKNVSVCLLLHNFEIKVNIGSMFRLADAFGLEHIYLTGLSATPPNRKITKTSRSAEKYIDFSYVQNPLDVIVNLKEKNYKIISLELTNKSIALKKLRLQNEDKICLILGSENNGVSQSLLDESDLAVHIPMHGELSSMNVATAAGIALYTITNSL